jgi:hypothetical protein
MPEAAWASVACSADGSRWVAASSGLPALGQIYTSTNSGESYNLTGAPAANWDSVACSADGTKLAATFDFFGEFGSVYVSEDSGVHWSQTAAPDENWLCVVSSADGTRLAASSGAYKGASPIFTSADSGASWLDTQAPAEAFVGLAASSDGGRLVALGQDGLIYTRQSAPVLSLAPSSHGVVFSWPGFYAGFVLQQTADLSSPNWTIVTNIPAITNGLSQLSVAPSLARAFYRLASP